MNFNFCALRGFSSARDSNAAGNDCTGDTRILGSLQIGEAESTSEPCSGEDYKEARGNKDESMSGKSAKKVSPSGQNARKEPRELADRTTRERLRENKVTKWTSSNGKSIREDSIRANKTTRRILLTPEASRKTPSMEKTLATDAQRDDKHSGSARSVK